MAIRIEFHKHGGPEVLQAVEFTPADPAENEIHDVYKRQPFSCKSERQPICVLVKDLSSFIAMTGAVR